jgi:hypothetical protein
MEEDAGEPVSCLFSHKCGERSHALAEQLAAILGPSRVELLVDRFHYGDDFDVRMQTFSFDALLFLLSPESLESRPCRVELETARRLGAPVFVAHTGDEIPAEFKGRYALDLREAEGGVPAERVRALGKAIVARAFVQRRLKALRAGEPPDATRAAAQALASDGDRTALAERAGELALKFRELEDPATCFWIALALGEAGTEEAAGLLRTLPPKEHPYSNEGVRQALALVASGG